MRISDWSSYLCTSDLRALVHYLDRRLRHLFLSLRRVAHARRAGAVSRAPGARGRPADAAVADIAAAHLPEGKGRNRPRDLGDDDDHRADPRPDPRRHD